MNLLLPAALGFLALIPLIVLLYMLRVHRQDVFVSSLMLWRDLKDETAERVRWRPPLRNVLLLLQVLAALLLAFALAKPTILGAQRAQKNIIVLVDASASMQAVDVRPSRFAEAKRQARALVDGLNSDDTVTVLRVTDRATVVGAGSDRLVLTKAVDDLQPGVGGADMKTALLMAKSLSRAGVANEVHIFSDGGFTGAEEVKDIPAPVKLSLIGRESANIGVTAISARPIVLGGARCEGFARLTNFADRDVQIPLTATVDGTVIEQRTVQLAARASSDLWYDLPLGSRLLEVKIAANDALPADDVAQALCPKPRQIEAVLVTDTPNNLQPAMSLLPNVKLTTITHGQYSAARQADLFVFETFVPERLPSGAGAYLVVGPKNGGSLFEVELLSSPGPVVKYDAAHPLLNAIEIGAIQPNRVARFALPDWGRAVAETEEGPLIVVGDKDNRRIVALAFELNDANVAQRLQFPLLIANAVNYLAPEPVPAVAPAGQPIVVQPVAGVAEILVERPNGETDAFAARGEAITYSRTETLGRYRIVQKTATWVAAEDQFVVGPAPETESRIRPNGEIVFNSVDPGSAGLRDSVGQEIWPWLAFIGLALIGAEWWWYHFRR